MYSLFSLSLCVCVCVLLVVYYVFRFLGLGVGLGCCCVRSHTTAELAANFLPQNPSFFFVRLPSVKQTDFKLSWMIWTRMPGEKTKSDLVLHDYERQKKSQPETLV